MSAIWTNRANYQGKTIVFALTQEHAVRLAEVFEEMYPQWPGMVSVITHKSEYKGTLVKKFKKESYPRIAISVDMLDTGVDIPEVVNLVFMKPVHSYIKLTQMIGRGTRSQETCKHLEWLPKGEKKEFLIIDFWQNDFGKDRRRMNGKRKMCPSWSSCSIRGWRFLRNYWLSAVRPITSR